jgi:polyhydroxybutyrate depolymerase
MNARSRGRSDARALVWSCAVGCTLATIGCSSDTSPGSGGGGSSGASHPSTTSSTASISVSQASGATVAGTGAGTGGNGTTGCGAAGAPTGDLHLQAVDGKGTTRDYELLVPASYDSSKPLALVFVYHGAGGDESASKSFGIQGANGASDAAIFAFPRGVQFQSFGVGWDDSCGGYDMPFFDAMLASIESTYCIDTHRVFAAGFSWGGDQTTALACCRGDKLRAVAPASCTDEFGNAADPTSYSNLPCPVPTNAAVRFTHATDGDGPYPAPLFATTSALFRSFAGCTTTSNATTPSPCVAFDGCAQPYVECPYDGLGHSLPGDYGPETWAFFASFQ